MRNLLWAISIGLIACSTSPEEIPYGQAECAYCRMSVVDQQHAAELVTSKGKVVFFDAIECMVNYRLANEGQERFAHALVNDFTDPGSLIPAEEASYLISQQLPSPMGAFLTGFPDQEELDKAVNEYGGREYTWEEILDIGRANQFGKFSQQ